MLGARQAHNNHQLCEKLVWGLLNAAGQEDITACMLLNVLVGNFDSGFKHGWVQIPGSLLRSWVIFSRSLNFCKPQFFTCRVG